MFLRFAFITLSLFMSLGSAPAFASSGVAPCDPISEFLDPPEGQPSLEFCARWNPEFSYRGNRCCASVKPVLKKHRPGICNPKRAKANYCDEMTDSQKAYAQAAASGRLGDMLELIARELDRNGTQAYCSPNDGFLAWGRKIIPTQINRLKILRPHRCLDFGTDRMVGMLEWVGRRMNDEFPAHLYPQVMLMIGDVSAPRGGCLSGRSGRKGHSSHTNGQDADLGFLSTNHRILASAHFHRTFDAKVNWWLLKQIFKNPFACVKAVFLDRRHIRALEKQAVNDPEWELYRRFIRHIKGHRNHFHVRIGEMAGKPGCSMDSLPELEDVDGLEDGDEEEGAPSPDGAQPEDPVRASTDSRG